MLENIAKWLTYDPRNKLVFVSNKVPDLEFVDLGYALSAKIKDYVSSPNIAMFAEDALKEILSSATHNNQTIGDYVAISNWGILFEEKLCLNIPDFFASNSQMKVLIAQNSGKVIDDKFYLAYPNRQYSFDLNNIQYYIIK